MATISSLITNIRYELWDVSTASEFTDDVVLAQVKKAVRRANRLLAKHGIRFAKSTNAFSTASGTATYSLPSDFMLPEALYRLDDDIPLEFVGDGSWVLSEADTLSEALYWRINTANTHIEIGGTPASVISMVLYYWPLIDTSSYTTSTDMPWGGRMDDAIEEYVAVRLRNVDEQDVSVDVAIQQEMERFIIDTYGAWEPSSGFVEPMAGSASWRK